MRSFCLSHLNLIYFLISSPDIIKSSSSYLNLIFILVSIKTLFFPPLRWWKHYISQVFIWDHNAWWVPIDLSCVVMLLYGHAILRFINLKWDWFDAREMKWWYFMWMTRCEEIKSTCYISPETVFFYFALIDHSKLSSWAWNMKLLSAASSNLQRILVTNLPRQAGSLSSDLNKIWTSLRFGCTRIHSMSVYKGWPIRDD